MKRRVGVRIERALLKPWMVKAALLPTLLFVGRGVGSALGSFESYVFCV